jgi:hypothetical protein
MKPHVPGGNCTYIHSREEKLRTLLAIWFRLFPLIHKAETFSKMHASRLGIRAGLPVRQNKLQYAL